ncbi:uncharacterized protein LOC112054426 isoform X2 [Bicyclus anynana]|uniref:Uncharacterized protein LOC112054426 isoform X2 n=1 Tax=Bicyclus anynana TaxID=110368 RepID=A0A6J1NQJ8_BICAN|nr:uncharacterized protein LOC112054426 isoform X2 [Bicyclus anynana]
MGKKFSAIWKYFKLVANGMAKCRVCRRIVPRTCRTTTCMWKHIKRNHKEEYKELTKPTEAQPVLLRSLAINPERKNLAMKKIPPERIQSNDEDTSSYYEVIAGDVLKDLENDDTAEQPQQSESSDAWKLFEKITTNRSAQNASSDSDNENYYTEVVYLEDDQPGGGVSNAKIIKPLKRKPELRVKKENPTPIPIKRTPITRYENVYIKKNKEGEPKKDDTDEDIENFGRYVIGLLKKIPKDVCTQLQMDIINMIMTAKLKISTPVVPDTMNVSYSNDTETSRAVIVTTPSNVVHTNHNNESVPSLVIEVNNTKNHNNESLSSLQ